MNASSTIAIRADEVIQPPVVATYLYMPTHWGYLLGPWCICERPLRGGEFTTAYVADGSRW